MVNWRTDWIKTKRDVALRLASGECGGSYGEAVIILCATISALAAEVWPGEGKDRKRFVEALKCFPPSDLNMMQISVPLLIEDLRKRKLTSEMKSLEQPLLKYGKTRVVTGVDVDKDEDEIIHNCPKLNRKIIRSCCYANLLYEEIRSGYVHEYRPGSRADSWPMASVNKTLVSYVNRDPFRHIHFHVSPLAHVALAVAEQVDKVHATLPQKDPLGWWVEG